MGSLLRFLEDLLGEGRVGFRGRPEPAGEDRGGAEQLLREFHDEEGLGLAGPAPPFDVEVAIWAADWTRRACWFLVSRAEAESVVEEQLAVAKSAVEPGCQLSADLCFRYLPLIHRRARALAPGDLLTGRLAELFRRWPLSGVLSDVHEEPLAPLEWEGYPGLAHLYAERLASNPKAGWMPAEGRPAREVVDLVRDRAARAGRGRGKAGLHGGLSLG